MGHTGLVAHESGQVHGLFGVILSRSSQYQEWIAKGRNTHLGERFNFTTVTSSALSWEETKGPVSGRFELDHRKS